MFKKTILSAAVAAILSVGAMSAQAADTGFYASAGIGQSRVSEGPFDGTDFGYKLGVGYQFVKNFGAEIEYLNGGSPDDNGVEVKDLSVINMSVRGTMPVAEKVDLFAKVGMAAWDYKGGKGSDDFDFSWGWGGTYKFNDRFSADVEYQRYDVGQIHRVDYMGVAVGYRF